ncbi:hypothetical protein BcFMB_02575 [Bifidobacterium choerinum]|uniref:Uncharacterized protein n=1 Tax=Bifidobacterium choerinum TaxID=35760 RepID=A0A2D3D4I1_9BIFI|nr:hypothetical protein BcFMB_02575 [Bifidobacterium choerinum]
MGDFLPDVGFRGLFKRFRPLGGELFGYWFEFFSGRFGLLCRLYCGFLCAFAEFLEQSHICPSSRIFDSMVMHLGAHY